MANKPSIDTQLARYDELIERWAPSDESEYPFTMSQERREGVLVWWVCIQVKVKDRDDFSIESEDPNLRTALANALHRLTRYHKAANEAALADYGFGIKYPLRQTYEAHPVNQTPRPERPRPEGDVPLTLQLWLEQQRNL